MTSWKTSWKHPAHRGDHETDKLYRILGIIMHQESITNTTVLARQEPVTDMKIPNLQGVPVTHMEMLEMREALTTVDEPIPHREAPFTCQVQLLRQEILSTEL